jgi:hypothetical protein
MINPFSINPLGTGQQLVSSAASVKEILTDPSEFNKYSQQDPVGLFNPLIQDLVGAYTGGRPPAEALKGNIAALRLKGNLEHPGRGQIYPTSRGEALGQFGLGSMFPRMTSEAGIKASLQRERADQPEQRIDDELKIFKDTYHETLPKEFVDAYRSDLKSVKRESDFQHSYANDHGSQGFSNMPAQNRAQAAIDYLTKYHLISSEDLISIRDSVNAATSDAEMNQMANTLWNLTGSGKVKQKWDELMHGAQATSELTPLRP